MKAHVQIFLKDEVADVAGRTVAERLTGLGYGEVKDVRIGKIVEITLQSADRENSEKRLLEMCNRLLVNSTIEEFSIQVVS